MRHNPHPRYGGIWPHRLILLKILGVAGFATLLFVQLQGWKAIPELYSNLTELGTLLFSQWGGIALILVVVNISMEALKWLLLMGHRHPMSFSKALQNILMGWTTGLFTPQRIGEYAGRLVGLKKEERPRGVYSTFVTSVAQNITHLLGVIPLLIGSAFYSTHSSVPVGGAVLYLSLAITAIGLYAYIDRPLGFLYRRLTTISYLQQFLPSVQFSLPKRALLGVLLYSLIRYTAYLSLFVLLLQLLVPETPLPLLYLYLPLVFLLQSGVPLPPALSFLARIEFALLALRGLDLPPVSIAAAGIALWVLNLLLPSLLGMGLLLRYTPKNKPATHH